MKVPTLYLDTSVIGGYHDAEWMNDTRELWKQMEAGKWEFVSSELVAEEIADAPEEVRALFVEKFPRKTDLFKATREVEILAEDYLKAGVVSEKFADDAKHVAISTVNRVSHLVSWNFRHLVNVRREAGFNAVNLLKGYPPVSIVSPKELIYANTTDES